MIQFVNNYIEPIELTVGDTAATLALPDGDYLLTLADSDYGATRWEIVQATVAASAATLTRGATGTTAQAWEQGSVIYCTITANTINDIMSFKASAAADIISIQQRLDVLETPPVTDDGYFTADAGAWNPTHDNGDGTTGRWEVPPGTTFTAISPGAIETDTSGGLGSLIAFAGGSSNYAPTPWTGTFTFASSGPTPGSGNGQNDIIEKYYYSSDGAWTGCTVNVASPPSDMILYVRLYLNQQT